MKLPKSKHSRLGIYREAVVSELTDDEVKDSFAECRNDGVCSMVRGQYPPVQLRLLNTDSILIVACDD